jgi:hypothetical protein
MFHRPAFRILGALLGTVLTTGLAQAACSSPYYPVREGLTRSYQGTAAGQKLTYTETISAVTAQGFKITTKVGPNAVTAAFKCGPNGVSGTPSVSTPGLKITSLTMRGVTQPPRLAVGTAWTSGVTVVGTVQGQPIRNETDISLKVVGREQVKVPAGTFTAFRIESTTTVKVTAAGQNLSPPVARSTSWVAEGVGNVKTTIVTPPTTIELVRYK